MMIHDTHQFQTGKNSSNVNEVIGSLLNIRHNELHERAVKYYFNNKKNDEYGWCRNKQWQALAIECDVIICVILKQNVNYRTNVTVKLYGKSSSLEKQCICMYFDETTSDYYSLSITNDEITKMTYDDSVKESVRIYIRDEIKYKGEVDFDDTYLKNSLAPSDNEQPNGHETIVDSIAMNGTTKRKLGDIDGILPPLNDNRQLPNENPDEVPNKRPKLIEAATGRMPLSCKHKSESKAMEELIQGERIHHESVTDDTHEDEQPISPMALFDEHHEEKTPDDQCNEDICSANSDLL